MSQREIVNVASRLGIPRDLRAAIRDWPLVVVLLGEAYLHAIEPPVEANPGQRILFLAKRAFEPILRGPGRTVVPIEKSQTARFGAGFVELKGKVFELSARALCARGEQLWSDTCSDDSPVTFLQAVQTAHQL